MSFSLQCVAPVFAQMAPEVGATCSISHCYRRTVYIRFHFLVYRPPVARQTTLTVHTHSPLPSHSASCSTTSHASFFSLFLVNNHNNLFGFELKEICLCMEINKRAQHFHKSVFLTTQQCARERGSRDTEKSRRWKTV